MFYHCSNLANIDLSRFDFAKVERMDDIFYGGDSSDNFVKVSGMIESCNNLRYLKLSKNCRAKKSIKVDKITIEFVYKFLVI